MVTEKKTQTKRKVSSGSLQPKKTSIKRSSVRKPKIKPLDLDVTGERIRSVLLELMCSSESDAVRVSAAKALMDKLKQEEAAMPIMFEGEGCENDERAIIEEAEALLAAFTKTKSGGDPCTDKMVTDSAAEPDHA